MILKLLFNGRDRLDMVVELKVQYRGRYREYNMLCTKENENYSAVFGGTVFEFPMDCLFDV